MITVIACGVDRGKTKELACPCCGYESNDPEDFATSSCWACAFGMNIRCDNCIKVGVGVNHAYDKHAKLHRLRSLEARELTDDTFEYAVTKCGYWILLTNLGSASAAGLVECRHCWREAS